MPVTPGDVKVGSYFKTPKGQLRKVTEVVKDDRGRTRVRFVTKRMDSKNQPFAQAATDSQPALMQTFLRDCGELLAGPEIAQLRTQGVVLPNE